MTALVIVQFKCWGRGDTFACPLISLRLNNCLGTCAIHAGLHCWSERRVLHVFRYASPVTAGLLIDPGDSLPERSVTFGLSRTLNQPGLSSCGGFMHGEWQMVPLQVRVGISIDPCPKLWVVTLTKWAFQISVQDQGET